MAYDPVVSSGSRCKQGVYLLDWESGVPADPCPRAGEPDGLGVDPDRRSAAPRGLRANQRRGGRTKDGRRNSRPRPSRRPYPPASTLTPDG